MKIKFIFRTALKFISFIFKSINVTTDKNNDTHFSLNINDLIKRAIYACVNLF